MSVTTELIDKKAGLIMGILFIGIGLLVGIHVWVERSETSHEWANCQERLHFEQEQKKREWKKWANKTLI